MWDKLKTRLLSAIVLIAILLVVVFFATDLVFSLVVCALTFMIMAELTKVMRLETKPGIVITNYVFAAIFMALGFLNIELQHEFMYMLIILYVMTLGAFAVLDNSHIKLSDVCSSIFMVTYSVVFLMHLSFIRQLDNGVAFLFMPVIGAYITDTGAYFTGLSIGRHKLIPSVSPKKTVEGAIGGIAAAVVGFVIYGFIMSSIGFSVNYVLLIILGALCAVVAQLGDLTASVIKRNYSVKDFGHLIPGHGGMVDRVDSLMFTAPVVYYFITFLPVIS